jgi:quinohemoprotein amine dehydrogenase
MVKVVLAIVCCVAVLPAAAQTNEGIPVKSDLVLARCGTCHKADDQKRMSRISFRRTTPENWERTIKRMIQLNHVRLEASDARAIVKYLSDNHGLAPSEAEEVKFETEHRMDPFSYTPDRETAIVCSSCHSIGRAMSERRTKEEWDLLLAMHRGYYPGVDNQPMNEGQGFRRTRAVEGNADKRHPMERIVEHLSKAYPLTTSAWAEWSTARQAPMLGGRWTLGGYVPGKGAIYGVMTITPVPNEVDTYVTEARYTFPRTGETATRKGRGVVYAGYQWRGRSALSVPARAGSHPYESGDTWREVMLLERAQKSMSGRWFGGGYDELGMEVMLTRIGAEPIVAGASVPSMKAGSSNASLRLHGANFPARLLPSQISLGQGVTVTRVVSTTPEVVTLSVEVAKDAAPGPRDILVAGAHAPAAFTVFDKVDGVRVLPQAGLARVGGVAFPKQYQQFEAVAFHNGPDKTPNTADDWSLGAVDAGWSMEEYAATFDDTDIKYVGAIDAAGLFTPNVDGPNPERRLSEADQWGRNNIGDVWVVATVAPDPGRGIAAPIRARSQLVVAPPVYVNWLASGIGQ